jgi:methionyl-tRNA formyltransferase
MKFGIIGNEQMVQNCVQILKQTPGAEISFLLYDISKLNPMNPLDAFCVKNSINSRGISKLNTPENYEFIKEHQPDYLLSINNFFVIKENFLAVPRKGTINFHNSAPSKYHGLNIPSWVIINGEETHGAMWHFVENTIDTGEVIIFDEFPLTKNETAASLMVKCIRKGIEMFPALIQQLLNENITVSRQSSNSSYYGKKDYPANMGYIDFKQSGKAIDQLVRGLNYQPFRNTYLYAKIKHNEKEIIINTVTIDTSREVSIPGRIALINEHSFEVECKDAIISITDAMDDAFDEYEGLSIAEYLGVKLHDTL